jgi:twitching motility protein PilT
MNVDVLRLHELLELARVRGASDLHVGAGEMPSLRLQGAITRLDLPPIGAEALGAFIEAMLPPTLAQAWQSHGSIDIAGRSGPGAPYRLHAYRTMAGTRFAFRLLARQVPTLEALALPEILASQASRPAGLLLFTGPTGSGKTTALAGIVDCINRDSSRIIVTVEDPVEYVHVPQRSVVVHCEIGADVADYAAAVRGFMRSDPDVILVGEMRDRDTMEAVLSAAETGHLVLSSVHTNDAAQTVDRIIDAFASAHRDQIRSQLAATLTAVVSLRLVPTANGSGRVAAAEVLTATDAVRALIREGKTHQLRNAILTGRAAGMQTLEASLSSLVVRRTVSLETARRCANRPDEIRDVARIAG